MSPLLRQTGLVLAAALVLVSSAPAQLAPLKPYDQVVDEVIGFLFADVGYNGILTNDDDPGGYPVPPYFYSYAINDGNNLDGNLNGYPGYLSVSYPAYTACVAIDAFLDWRRFDGDGSGEALARARAYADWILEHRTPAGDLYGNLPYSTQTDGVMGGGWDGPAIMTDKPPMFALRLLRLFDITGDASYWNGAVEIADVMAATQLTGGPEDNGRWPFRVVPADGTVTQDYTSHLQPAARFFDAMAARTGSPTYQAAADRAWAWLLANPGNAASPDYMHYEGFYEDQTPAMQTGFGDHYSGHEMIVELLRRQPAGWEDLAVATWDSMSARFLSDEPFSPYAPFVPVTLEWFGWPEATYASSLQFARTALLLDQALAGDPRHDPAWRPLGLDMAAVCSHGQNTRKNDGRMFTTVRDLLYYFNSDSWYEQNFNTVKYFLEIMALEPALAPTDRPRILAMDRALTSVSYPDSAGVVLSYATFGDTGRGRVRVLRAPDFVRFAGIDAPATGSPPDSLPGWFYDPATGVLDIHHDANPVTVHLAASSVPGTTFGDGGLRLRMRTPAGAMRAIIGVELEVPGNLDLAVYDLQGRLVRRLAAGEFRPSGRHDIAWDGRDRSGRRAAAGVYLVRGRSGSAVAGARLLLVR